MTDETPHPHSRAGLQQRFGPRYRWWVLLTVMIGTMASIMASTIINVAVPPAYHVNGELTLGENIADNVGLVMAYRAWQRSLKGQPSPVIDGMTGEQRFFYGFAQSWSGKTRDAALLAQIKSDPHAPDEFRVLGVLRNHPGFHTTFGVKPGDKMYLAPADRVSIW